MLHTGSYRDLTLSSSPSTMSSAIIKVIQAIHRVILYFAVLNITECQLFLNFTKLNNRLLKSEQCNLLLIEIQKDYFIYTYMYCIYRFWHEYFIIYFKIKTHYCLIFRLSTFNHFQPYASFHIKNLIFQASFFSR